MKLIVVPDIFGKTPELIELVSHISSGYRGVQIIDPYKAQAVNFSTEESAYQYFAEFCGAEKLAAQLEKAVQSSAGRVDIIGFSVGATCAWEFAGKNRGNNIRQVVGFYGSRIREKTVVEPQVPTCLIFPADEETFELEPVIQLLEQKSHTRIIRTNFLHGFMNRQSRNFSEIGFQQFCCWLNDRDMFGSSACR